MIAHKTPYEWFLSSLLELSSWCRNFNYILLLQHHHPPDYGDWIFIMDYLAWVSIVNSNFWDLKPQPFQIASDFNLAYVC